MVGPQNITNGALAAFAWVIARLVIVYFGVFLVVLFLIHPRLEVDQTGNDIASTYLTVLGTIYAVLLAFVVFVVWEQFNDTRKHLEHEANEAIDLYRIALQPPFAQSGQVGTHLTLYIQAVLAEELRPHDARVTDATQNALREIWQALMAVEPGTQRENTLLDHALQRFQELTDLRTYRLLSADERLPWGLRWVVYVGGAVTVGSMGFFTLDSFWLLAAMALCLAVIIALVLAVVADLDSPFEGTLRIPVHSLHLVHQRFETLAQFEIAPRH